MCALSQDADIFVLDPTALHWRMRVSTLTELREQVQTWSWPDADRMLREGDSSWRLSVGEISVRLAALQPHHSWGIDRNRQRARDEGRSTCG